MALDKKAIRAMLRRNRKKFGKPEVMFWEPFHELDKVLTPDCIRLETYKSNPFRPDSYKSFPEGDSTIVIKVRDEDVAIARKAVDALNLYFIGAHVGNTLEECESGGEHYWQIRSSVDKALWERMCFFLKEYSFEEELDQQQRESSRDECRRIVEQYSAHAGQPWKSLDGVPAFCTLLGMHGLLRPIGKHTANIQRKREELNKQHPRGTPLLMDGVPLSVQLDRNGDYIIGYSLHEQALMHTMEDGCPVSFGAELLGGGKLGKNVPFANKVLNTTGIMLGLWAIGSGEKIPCTIAVGGAAIAGVAYAHNRARLGDEMRRLRRQHGEIIRTVKDEGIHELSQVDQRLRRLGETITTHEGQSKFAEVVQDVRREIGINAEAIHNVAEHRPRAVEELFTFGILRGLQDEYYGAGFHDFFNR